MKHKIFSRLKRLVSNAGDSMSVKSIKEDDGHIPIPKEIYNWKIVLVAITAASAAIIIGYDTGFIGGTVELESFQKEFGMDKMSSDERSLVSANVVSIFHAGAFWGALLMYPIGELFGRKIGLIVSGFILTLGCAIALISK